MLTPAASDASSTYYKIGTTVTFSWSYTSVQVIPTAVNVEAYCATNKYVSSSPKKNVFQRLIWALDFIILWRRIFHLLRQMCCGILKLMMQMQHNLFSRSHPPLSLIRLTL